MSAMTPEEAIAELKQATPTDLPWTSRSFTGMSYIATILNAAASGELIPASEVQALKAERDRAIEDAIYNAQYVDLVSGFRAENTWLRSKLEAADKLAEASAGVIQRWDSQDWKSGHTGDFITRLRAAQADYTARILSALKETP